MDRSGLIYTFIGFFDWCLKTESFWSTVWLHGPGPVKFKFDPISRLEFELTDFYVSFESSFVVNKSRKNGFSIYT